MEYMVAETDKRIHPRVAQDMERLRQAVCHSIPDVETLILTGSFAHGEGAFQNSAGGLQPFNDYDVVVVAKIEPDPRFLKDLARQVARMLGMRGVDLLGVGLHRFAWLPPSIFNFDLRHAGYVVHGDATLLDTLLDWQPSDIPLIEAQVLLLNRMICLLECVEDGPETPQADEETGIFLAYQSSKAAFAIADAVALLHGMYAIRYEGKRDLLRSLVPAASESVALAAAAWRLRQGLEPASLGMPPDAFWRRTRAALLPTFTYLMNWMYARDRPFTTPQDLAHFIANYASSNTIRGAIEAAQYLTLAAWDESRPDRELLALARDLLARVGIACPGTTWPLVRRTVVAAWFRYCH